MGHGEDFGFYLKEVGLWRALSIAGMWSGSGAHGCPLMAVREQAVGHEARSHWGPAWRDGASPGGRRWEAMDVGRACQNVLMDADVGK